MLTNHDWRLDASRGDLRGLKDFFASRREFLVGQLRNPNLLEHDAFTDMLWAVFHLAEELDHRENPATLPESDLQHLSGDMKRAFEALTVQWLAYMAHLQGQYPYLFSLAARTNPFDAHPPVMVT